jgi:hypothetical protein
MISVDGKYLSGIDKKITKLDRQLTKQLQTYLNNLSKQEQRINKVLAKFDSSKAAGFFIESGKGYEQLLQGLTAAEGKTKAIFRGEYLPYLDSLQGAFGFLANTKGIISKSEGIQQKLGQSLERVNQLQNRLQHAEDIKAYLSQRQEQLGHLLAGYTSLPRSLGKTFGKYQEQIYYYGQQVKAYREALNDPDRLLKKLLGTLQNVPGFKKFMSKYSMLSQLFPAPDNYDPSQTIQGLPSRQQVMSLIQDQTGNTSANVSSMVQQNTGSARSQVDELRNRINQSGGNGNDLTMPDFKPDNMPTAPFLRKLEYGTSFQSQRANNYFPATSDIGATLGYKAGRKSIIGIGITAKIGWGTGWQHIKVSSQGIGLRFFADWKVPSIWSSKEESWWLSGGAEMNYRTPVERLEIFKNYHAWTRSALAGISKKFSAGKKLNGTVSVLFDFLYRQHIPVTEPILFRVGYTFK